MSKIPEKKSAFIPFHIQIHHRSEQIDFRPNGVENEVGIHDHMVGWSKSRVRGKEQIRWSPWDMSSQFIIVIFLWFLALENSTPCGLLQSFISLAEGSFDLGNFAIRVSLRRGYGVIE